MMKTAPNPIDVQELQFKLHCRLKVFENTNNENFNRHCNLVTAASRFGLIFVGTNTSQLQVIPLKDVEKYTKSDGDKSDYVRRNLSLPSPPSHISVNCEHSVLAVVIEKDSCPWVLFYDVISFWHQEILNIGEARLSSTPGVQITEVNWNPTLATVFTACKNDGSLGVYELKNAAVDINELPAAAGVTCFCWSPKGKQIAVGSRDGKITQLKPDLKAVKVINPPPFKEPYSMQSLQWVSNYQFIGVFQSMQSDGQAVFIVIDAPKSGEPVYTNYDDICYSNGSTRPIQFYMILVQNWNILMAASSNSMEVGILGNAGENWTQWIMGDASRAELPLSANHQETLPIGFTLDIGSTQPLQWGESTLPPAPLLLLYSHHGILCCFSTINLQKGIPSICTPPDVIKNTSGLQQFTSKSTELTSINNALKDINKIIPQTNESSKVNTSNTVTTGINLVNSALPTIQIQPTMTTVQPMNLSQTKPIDLFAGQATLSPIIPTNKKTPVSSVPQYQSLFPTQSYNENKSGIKTTVEQVSISTEGHNISKPVVVVSSTFAPNDIQKSSRLESNEDVNKTELINIDLKAEEEAEKIFAQMVKDECVFLESEVKVVLHQKKNLQLYLGSEDDKSKIVENTKNLQDFFHEVMEICITQSAEVHMLKQNLLQSWAWYEEAKSRHLASDDESMMILLRSQPLDSASEKQLADIRHTNYYLESQISQAHLALDEQWESFQDYCKKTHKIQIPTMEVIFQTMVKQNAILRKQGYILKDIASRIKMKSRLSLGTSLLITVDDITKLPDELKRLRMNTENVCQIQHDHAMKKMKNFTKKKVDTLRVFLKRREFMRILAVKPQLSTSVIHASPSSKLKQKSSLVSKESVSKKLDFVQSTPKVAVSKSEPVMSVNHPKTPIEGLQNFTLTFNMNNFSQLTGKTNTGSTSNLISTNPNSAFVSTYAANTSISNLTLSDKPKLVSFSTSATTTSITKTVPSYVIVTSNKNENQSTTNIATNVVKTYSFSSAPSFVSSQGDITKTKNLFNSETTSSSFGTGELKSTFINSFPNVSGSKPNLPKNNFTSVPLCKVETSNPNTVSVFTTSSNLVCSTSTVAATINSAPSFSFGLCTSSNIFGDTTQKSQGASLPSTTTKSFTFSTKSLSVTSTAIPSNVISQKSIVNPVSTLANSSKVTSQSGDTLKSTMQAISSESSASDENLSTTQSVVFRSNPTIKSQTTALSTDASKSLFASTSVFAVSCTPLTTSGITTLTSLPVTNTISSGTTIVDTSSSQVSANGANLLAKSNIFGGATTSSTALIIPSVTSTTVFNFGTATTKLQTSNDTKTNTKPLFDSTIATSATTLSPTVPPTSVSPASASAFGITTSANQSLFGLTSSTITSAKQSSIFSITPSTLSTSFGTQTVLTTQSSIFSTPLSTSNAGIATGTTSTTQLSIFGVTPSTSVTSVFGATTRLSTFGTTTSSTSATTVFGDSTPSTTQSIFGSVNNTSQASTFGSGVKSTATTTTTTTQSIFGSPVISTTSQSQSFGMFADAAQKSSVFGNSPATSPKPSLFGSNNQSTVFGSSTSTTSSVFGQNNQSSTTFGQSSVFGSTGSTFGNTNVFGTSSSTFGPSNASIFGNSSTTTTASIFGGTSATRSTFGSSGGVFGTPASTASTPFGSGNVFAPNTTQSSFSASTSTGSFGFGNLNVGSPQTTSTSSFGLSTTQNPFGSPNKNVFGSPPASSSNSVFGSPSGSLFGAPQNFSNSFGNQSVFAQQSTFGQTSFGTNTFGQSSAGPFSGGTSGGVGQTGFGTSTSFQKPAFGSSPMFGGSPSFGGTPSFGGAPTFGSSPTFGGTSKIFGATNSGFGNESNVQSTGFGNLANQPTVGFGNLAQQATNAATPGAPFSGNSSFSSWR